MSDPKQRQAQEQETEPEAKRSAWADQWWQKTIAGALEFAEPGREETEQNEDKKGKQR